VTSGESLFEVVQAPDGRLEIPDDALEPFEFTAARRFGSPMAGQAAAVLSPLLRYVGAVEDDIRAHDAKLAVLAVLADRGGVGQEVSHICDALASRYSRAVVRDALRMMLEAGTIQRARKHDPRVTPTLQAALALALVPSLTDVQGHRGLLEMFDRARSRVGAGVEVTRMDLISLRRIVAIYTSDARRVAREGSVEEVLAHTSMDEADLKQRFASLSQDVERIGDLHAELTGLSTAMWKYIEAAGVLASRVFGAGRRLADARLLPVVEYQRAMRTASTARLAAVFDGILFDAPPVYVDMELVEQVTVEAVGDGAPDVIPEPVLDDGTEPDGLTMIERWRRRADDLLVDQRSIDLVRHLQTQIWPGPAVATSELVALSVVDRQYALTRTEALLVSPTADASILTPSVLAYEPDNAPPVPEMRGDVDAAVVATTGGGQE
jgi:hypothetical protein